MDHGAAQGNAVQPRKMPFARYWICYLIDEIFTWLTSPSATHRFVTPRTQQTSQR
jgi:hypothetical protein